MATLIKSDHILDLLRDAAGNAIVTDATELHFIRQDVFSDGPEPLALFRPLDIETLSRGIAAATAAGVAVTTSGTSKGT